MTDSTTDIGLSKQRLMFIFSLLAVALALVVVILGAFTRLKGAGLGCPDWPGCYGHLLWPESASEVAAADALFPDTPVEQDKTWPEMVHRYFAGSLGLVILALTILSFVWAKWQSTLPKKLLVSLCFLVVLQAAFGMWTVTLKLWPQVVTAHLLGGFATLSLLWLLVQRLSPWRWTVLENQGRLQHLAIIAIVVLVVQISLGGWTSSNYAAMACPDLPTCHGVWWPQADFYQGFNFLQQVGPNYLGGLLDGHARTAIHMTHRIGALVVTLVLLILMAQLWLSQSSKARRMALTLLALLCIQVGLGISNIFWLLPLPVAVAHNGFGAILLLALVTLNHRLRTAQRGSEN